MRSHLGRAIASAFSSDAVGELFDQLGVEQVDAGLVLGNLDLLTDAGAIALDQGGDNRGRGERAEREVGVEQHAGRLAISRAGVSGESAERDHAIADSLPRRLRSPGTHHRKTANDDARVYLLQVVEAQSETLHHAAGEVVGHHVRLADQAIGHAQPIGRAEIEVDAALVGVAVLEKRAGLDRRKVVGRKGDAKRVDSGVGFDLDHIRAEIGHQLSCQRPRRLPAEINHSDALER